MVSEGVPNDLRHAYRVLDVPWDASPRTIRASYRTLIKRWHPDRYPSGTESHNESSLMTKLLNEAYGRIKEAPLRHGGALGFFSKQSFRTATSPSGKTEPSGSSRSEYVPRDAPQDVAEYYKILERARQAGARDDATRPFDLLGFFVRFVLGALFGGVLSFRVMIYLYQERPRVIYLGICATVLFCALASGFGGDAFWRAIRPGGPWWWGRWD